jgi:hypothetical protein
MGGSISRLAMLISFYTPSGDPDYNQLQKTSSWRRGVAEVIICNRMNLDGFVEGPAKESA